MNLIHPISIRVQPISRPTTSVDQRAREEVQIIDRLPAFTIPAQVEYREFATHGKLAHFTRGGLQEGELGYVALRTVDVQAASWVPAIGDRFTELGIDTLAPRTLKVYVVRIKPFAHYPVVGYLGIKCYFSDREPSHNA